VNETAKNVRKTSEKSPVRGMKVSLYNTMKNTIKTNNEGYGFHGTVQTNFRLTNEQTEAAYDAAARAVMSLYQLSVDEAVMFLDSRIARHLCDQLLDTTKMTVKSLTSEIQRVVNSSKGWQRAIADLIKEIRS
jgi:ribonuclease HI